MSYPCTGCGCCCKRIENAVSAYENIDEEYEFPYSWDENGKCSELMDDNSCRVYENRPLLCNIDKFIEAYSMDKVMAYEMNISACNKMMDEDNVDNLLRIKK